MNTTLKKWKLLLFENATANATAIKAWWFGLSEEQRQLYAMLENTYHAESEISKYLPAKMASQDLLEETGGERVWWGAISHMVEES